MFETEVKSNFPDVFDLYLTNQNHIPFYFCDYISKSQDIKNIKNEITAHMETNHEDIIEDIKTDNTGVENVIHLVFLDFFCPWVIIDPFMGPLHHFLFYKFCVAALSIYTWCIG